MRLNHPNSDQEICPLISVPLSMRNTLTFSEAWSEVFERAVSKDKLYAEVRAGRIPHTKIGAKILFRRDTLEAWFRQQETNSFGQTGSHQ